MGRYILLVDSETGMAVTRNLPSLIAKRLTYELTKPDCNRLASYVMTKFMPDEYKTLLKLYNNDLNKFINCVIDTIQKENI